MAVRPSDEVLAGHVHVVVVSVADEREVFDVGEATLAPLGEVMHLAPLMRLATPRVLAMPVTDDDRQTVRMRRQPPVTTEGRGDPIPGSFMGEE